MNYMNLDTEEYPISEAQIRSENPNISFSDVFKAPENYAFVFSTPKPTFNQTTQSVIEGKPVLTSKGHYEQSWVIVDLDEDQVLANQVLATKSLIEQFDTALMNLFEETAKSKKYDSRVTCALRAGYPGPFQAEGIAFATWMDGCNALAYQILSECQAGTRPIPVSVEEFLAEFPAITWPG